MYLRFKAQVLFDEVMITEKPKWNLKENVNNVCFADNHSFCCSFMTFCKIYLTYLLIGIMMLSEKGYQIRTM